MSFSACELLLEPRQRAVAQLGGLAEVALAGGLVDLEAGLLDLLLRRADLLDRLLLLLPVRLHAGGLLLQVGDLALDLGEALLRGLVLLLLERLALDLELDDPPLDGVDLGRHRVDLDAQARGGLVDEVDRLVGQEAVGDVAAGERGRGDERGVLDADAVVHLVALLQPAQDADRVLDARLAHVDRLEAPLEGGVLLDVLLVLVEGRRAHAAQLAAREHRLEHVRRVHRALGRARAHDRVQLVDEEDDLALGLGDLLEDGLQPVLELAAVLGARDERAEVEGDHPLVLQRLGHVALHDALGEALDDRGLADAGLADEHGVVLRAAGEDLHDAAHLVVAADDRVELALAGELGEVAAVLLEGLVAVLGVRVAHGLVAADVLEDPQQRVARDAGPGERLAGGGLRADEARAAGARSRRTGPSGSRPRAAPASGRRRASPRRASARPACGAGRRATSRRRRGPPRRSRRACRGRTGRRRPPARAAPPAGARSSPPGGRSSPRRSAPRRSPPEPSP